MKYDGFCICGEQLEEIEINQIVDYDSERYEGLFKCPNCEKEFDVFCKWTMKELVKKVI